jgi:heme/copper-type cytochrome/quinol oxidase subunit 4
MAQYPTFTPNRDFGRDMFNVAIGIAWQVALVALPIYIVIRTNIPAIWYCLAVVGVASVILKFTWYDHMCKVNAEIAADEARAVAAGD